MRSAPPGTGTSTVVEVTQISERGFCLVIAGRELFAPFAAFPWFQGAEPAELANVTLLHGDHLYWSDLDIDLSIECIEHPERFPLVSKQQPRQAR
jgi:hypothetical protein